MKTPLENIYDVFYSIANIDLNNHPELDVISTNNIVESYLQSAFYDYEENLKTELTIGEETLEDNTVIKVINEDIPRSHTKILGRTIYKNYLERELNTSLAIANQFNKKSELNVLGLQSKIVALRECLSRVTTELNRSYTRNVLSKIIN